MERYSPSPAFASAEGGRTLVDADDHAGDVSTISDFQVSCLSALELACMRCSVTTPAAFHRRFDLCDIRRRRLRVPHYDDLGAAHLPAAEVDEPVSAPVV